MPLTLALASLIAGLAGTGASIGETIANSGAPKPPPAPAPTPPPNQQQLLQQKALVGQQASNIEGATSGTAGPDFLALFAPYLAGIAGQPGANAAGANAAGQAFSTTNSQPPTNPVTGSVNLSDFINNQ